MKIESIRLQKFKAFQDAELTNLPNFCIVIGANGSGKSTIFSVFGFLRDALTTNVNTALMKLGGSRGIKEVRSRNSKGPIKSLPRNFGLMPTEEGRFLFQRIPQIF